MPFSQRSTVRPGRRADGEGPRATGKRESAEGEPARGRARLTACSQARVIEHGVAQTNARRAPGQPSNRAAA